MHASIGKREHSKLEIDAARSGGTAASQVLGVAAVWLIARTKKIILSSFGQNSKHICFSSHIRTLFCIVATAFVHILVNMFWTLLTLLSVKQINFSCPSNSLAVIVNFWISQGSVATQLRWGGNWYHSYSHSFLGNLSVKEFENWLIFSLRKLWQKQSGCFFLEHCVVVYRDATVVYRYTNVSMELYLKM